MADPHIAQRGPYAVELAPGDYWWCACGRSRQQPFCDGSHKGTAYTPVQVVIDAPRKGAWCACKRTGTSPWCDGSHARLPPG